MSKTPHNNIETSYRSYYGRLFSALIGQFGMSAEPAIEDAIQNAFLKSLKSWKPENMPDNPENWLYIVAKNDLINQFRRQNSCDLPETITRSDQQNSAKTDLRLHTLLLLASSKMISTQSKVLYSLKNIFGLSIREISESTLLKQDAIYKSIKRSGESLRQEFTHLQIEEHNLSFKRQAITTVEEMLYAVFNIGFDSFNEKIDSFVNEDLCLESLSLARLLSQEFGIDSTSNLLALLCFHLSRIPAKTENGSLITFFKQDRTKWDTRLIHLGIHYLKQPEKQDKYYIEALIISSHMSTETYDTAHWNSIIKLYSLLMVMDDSPIIKLNLCYALKQADRNEEALELLAEISKKLPDEHLYLRLVKAELLKEFDKPESEQIMNSLINNLSHSLRKNFLINHNFIDA
ncbi:DUF6596 domain-containing protein [Robertkochia solimangrovi]|uniref:DUF6596 domain-containing protein n=1 Tax=Robertkochia solimangrovi TaxID=2213046 RepID=UPI00117F7F72|nr:DUF6596 domain-containing protein [Robertkochia solimangrovi]TRZ42245.1 RNA polymerase [Robertkochia solimangrovi]